MKKLTLRTSATLSLLLLLTPFASHAAVNRAIVEGLTSGSDESHVVTYAHFMDGTSATEVGYIEVPLGPVNSSQDLIDSANTAIGSYASGQGYTLSGGVIWPYSIPLSFSSPSRSLNSGFQISSSRASWVSYSVDIASTISLAVGQRGTVYLEYADDSGFTTNKVEVGRYVNGNTGTLAVGFSLTQNATAQISGMIPAGKYVRLRTENNVGTPSFNFRSAQEVLLGSN